MIGGLTPTELSKEMSSSEWSSHKSHYAIMALRILLSLFLQFVVVASFLLDARAVVEARVSYDAAEASLGEVPEDFLDPVLFHVMRDPVLLPTSGTVVDRCEHCTHFVGTLHSNVGSIPRRKYRVMTYVQQRMVGVVIFFLCSSKQRVGVATALPLIQRQDVYCCGCLTPHMSGIQGRLPLSGVAPKKTSKETACMLQGARDE